MTENMKRNRWLIETVKGKGIRKKRVYLKKMVKRRKRVKERKQV